MKEKAIPILNFLRNGHNYNVINRYFYDKYVSALTTTAPRNVTTANAVRGGKYNIVCMYLCMYVSECYAYTSIFIVIICVYTFRHTIIYLIYIHIHRHQQHVSPPLSSSTYPHPSHHHPFHLPTTTPAPQPHHLKHPYQCSTQVSGVLYYTLCIVY